MDEKEKEDAALITEDVGTKTPSMRTTTTTYSSTIAPPTSTMGTPTPAATASASTPSSNNHTNSNGEMPTVAQSICPQLASQPYYHGLLPREDVPYLLKNNGDFLVRISQPRTNDAERQIIISLMVNKDAELSVGLRHIVIRKQSNKYQVEESPRFDFIPDLVEHFVKTGLPLYAKIGPDTKLVTPISRHKWELRHSDIELTKKLGAGVYGEVYRGRMKRKGHQISIAVKTARTTVVTKEGIKEMMHEARIQRNFVHPNVVRLYGVALDEDPIMIVMELVRSGSLLDYIKKNVGKISDTEKMNSMACGAAWGIEYLHNHSCIHRDIAARNCLYDNKAKNVKISDFGLSQKGTSYKMTHTQRVPIKWIAPECLLNFTFTQASDVFSYGVLLWEIYNDGMEPFEGKKTCEIKSMLLNGIRLDFHDSVNQDIKKLVLNHCWNDKPEDRYTMSEICKKLEVLSGIKQSQSFAKRNNNNSKASRKVNKNC